MVALQSRDRRSKEDVNEPTKSEWYVLFLWKAMQMIGKYLPGYKLFLVTS